MFVVLKGSRGRTGKDDEKLCSSSPRMDSMGTTNKLLFAASLELGRWLLEVLAEQPTGFYKYLCNKPHRGVFTPSPVSCSA